MGWFWRYGQMRYEDVIQRLRSFANPDNVAGMARFGINPEGTLGISVAVLRGLAKEMGRDHDLAERLWESGVHEARILASLVDEPARVTAEQMDRWAGDFDSWDVCDGCCSNLFDKTPFAYEKALAWSRREEEFVKRAAFAMMAMLAVHDKKAENERFVGFLPVIKREATDERNYVRKAVNWALRQIGKRNQYLNDLAIETAREVQALDSRAARWVGSDALRELTSEKAQQRLKG
jgi:3-methyladenine DNA glycosylase AlkD